MVTCRRATRAKHAPTSPFAKTLDPKSNLEFVCSTVMDADTLARARPHLVALGGIAGDELDAPAAQAGRQGPVLRNWDERGRRAVFLPVHD